MSTTELTPTEPVLDSTCYRPGPVNDNGFPLYGDFFVDGQWARVWYGGKVEWLPKGVE